MTDDRLHEIAEELGSWIAARSRIDAENVCVRLEVVGNSALRIRVTIDGAEDEDAEKAVSRLLSCGSDAYKILSERRKASGFLWEVP